MEKSRIIELIKERIELAKNQLQREIALYEKNKCYAVPDYSYYNGRMSAFNEAIELIGMLDKKNNK